MWATITTERELMHNTCRAVSNTFYAAFTCVALVKFRLLKILFFSSHIFLDSVFIIFIASLFLYIIRFFLFKRYLKNIELIKLSLLRQILVLFIKNHPVAQKFIIYNISLTFAPRAAAHLLL